MCRFFLNRTGFFLIMTGFVIDMTGFDLNMTGFILYDLNFQFNFSDLNNDKFAILTFDLLLNNRPDHVLLVTDRNSTQTCPAGLR